MRVLAIESSFDDSTVALVRKEGDVFFVEKYLTSSQVEDHAKFGGVVPEVAARLHVSVLPKLIDKVCGYERDGIDGVAVTAGPGLGTALRVGVESAKALAVAWDVPLIPVDHMEGHIYSTMLADAEQTPTIDTKRMFPALCLIVSGGHTELVLMKEHGNYQLVGQTRDDAAGEAFDKTARLLGLPFPGGPSISKAAKTGNAEAIAFPRPMQHSGDLDMSFSGLKTAVRVEVAARDGALSDKDVADVAASFEAAVVDVLVHKVGKAIEQYRPNSILLCGGVSANTPLRNALKEAFDAEICVHLPARGYTTDNAAMIGAVGVRMLEEGMRLPDPFIVDADPARELGGRWKWEL